MKISKDEAVYAVLKMVLNEQVSLRMVYDDLWLYYLLVGLDLSKQEVIDAEYEIKEAILNCLKENLEKVIDISGNKRIIDNVRNIQNNEATKQESEENKMTLFDLFTANAEWDTKTELTISYNHLGNTKWDSGQALDIIYKYEKFEVLSFYKNSLFLREQE